MTQTRRRSDGKFERVREGDAEEGDVGEARSGV